MARAVALCHGGPLDQQRFSVTVNPDGTYPPLSSRLEVLGVLYVPENPGSQAKRRVEEYHGGLGWTDHTAVVDYVLADQAATEAAFQAAFDALPPVMKGPAS